LSFYAAVHNFVQASIGLGVGLCRHCIGRFIKLVATTGPANMRPIRVKKFLNVRYMYVSDFFYSVLMPLSS